MCQRSICLNSPSKVNIGLSIVGRRPDGYHLLESLFWPLDFGDSIEVTRIDNESAIEMSWAEDAPIPASELPSPTQNSVWKSLQALAPEERKCTVHIRKRIPLGSGMGGGSSNAATVLRNLAPTELTEDELVQKAAAIGADVPYFLRPEPAWVTGIGEKRRYLGAFDERTASLAFLLVFLPMGTPTPAVFGRYREANTKFSPEKPGGLDGPLTFDALSHFMREAKNDLEPFVEVETPLVTPVLGALRSQPCLYAAVSGAGSTCFAVFETLAGSKKSLQELQAFFRQINCKSMTARTFRAG